MESRKEGYRSDKTLSKYISRADTLISLVPLSTIESSMKRPLHPVYQVLAKNP